MKRAFEQILISAAGVILAGVILAAFRDVDFVRKNITQGFDK